MHVILETAKNVLVAKQNGGDIPFYQKIGIAGLSGLIGGAVGNPADLANVRMQNDSKLEVKLFNIRSQTIFLILNFIAAKLVA